MEIIKEREDKLVTDEPKVCNGKYSIDEFCTKFWVKILDVVSPTPSDIVRANKKLSDVYWEVSREKAQAQISGHAKDIKILNTALDNLDVCRKCLNTMVWARSLERKVGLE